MKQLILLLLLLTMTIGSAHAQSPEQQAQEINDTVMSPFCPGRTLSACPSDDARKLRLQVIDWVKAGESEQQIREKLVSTYGEDVRGAPLAEGIGALAWYIPVLVGLAAVLILVLAVRWMSPRSQAVQANVEPGVNSVLKEKLEREIKQRLS